MAPLEDISDALWGVYREAAKAIGTPFFVFHPTAAGEAYRNLKAGAESWGNCQIFYSVKTNSFKPLLNELNALGACAEVVSLWEYNLAKSCGFLPNQIILNGPLKDETVIRRCIHDGVFSITLDDIYEYKFTEDIAKQSNRVARVGIRLAGPSTLTGAQSRFGIEIDDDRLLPLMEHIHSSPNMELSILHFHLGTQIEADEYLSMISEVSKFWALYKIGEDTVLDIGGGFPYRHDQYLGEQAFKPVEFFELLRQEWMKNCTDVPSLIIEPGRFIAAGGFTQVASVVGSKCRKKEPEIIVLDSGTNHNVMAAFYEHIYEYERVELDQKKFRFCGPLCMEDDNLSGVKHQAPPVRASLVAMRNAGAYSMSLARTFIQPLPAVIQVVNGGFEVLAERAAFQCFDVE
jgi:diaminopimelate decarboxylase